MASPVNHEHFYVRLLLDAVDAVQKTRNYALGKADELLTPGLNSHLFNLEFSLQVFDEDCRSDAIRVVLGWYEKFQKDYEARIRRALERKQASVFADRHNTKHTDGAIRAADQVVAEAVYELDLKFVVTPKSYRRVIKTRLDAESRKVQVFLRVFAMAMLPVRRGDPALWSTQPHLLTAGERRLQRIIAGRVWRACEARCGRTQKPTNKARLAFVTSTFHDPGVNARYMQVMSRFEQPPPADIDQANAGPELDQLLLGDEDP